MTESTWPLYDYQPGVGAYGGIDDRYRSRRRKRPVGFTVLETKRPPRKRKK